VIKHDLLQCLAQLHDAEAAEVAEDLAVPYANAAARSQREASTRSGPRRRRSSSVRLAGDVVVTVAATMGQNPLAAFVVRLSSRVEAVSTTGSQRS